jgi:Leucine-rich repeat (LRR) protein
VIGKLVALRRLNVSENELPKLPPEIGKLVSLQTLSVMDNQLTDLPSEIGKLVALKWLYVSRNQLTGFPSVIRKLTELTQLHMDFCAIVEVAPGVRVDTRCLVICCGKRCIDLGEALEGSRKRIRLNVETVEAALRRVRGLPVHNYLPEDVCALVGQFVGRA